MISGTTLTLQKSELDKANKDKRKVYPPTFSVTLVFSQDEGALRTVDDVKRTRTVTDAEHKKLEYRFPSLLVL
jgi:hypothetical protein